MEELPLVFHLEEMLVPFRFFALMDEKGKKDHQEKADDEEKGEKERRANGNMRRGKEADEESYKGADDSQASN